MKKIVSFDKTKINYDIKREQNDLFLVFIHGAGGDLSAWNKERDFFHKKGYSTLAIDLRGHGLSDRPINIDDYKLENFARDLKVILDEERIEKFIIIAHCFGGMIAIEFQKLYPDLAQKYILIDTTGSAPRRVKAAMFCSTPFLSLMEWITKRDKGDSKYCHVDFNKFVGTNDWDWKRIYSDITHTTLSSWLFTYKNIASFDGEEVLKNVKVPVLIIHGDKDRVFNLSKAIAMNDLIANSTLDVVKGANHIIVINNPDEINIRIEKFLEKTK